MNLSGLLYGLGATPLFSSRAFLPAFLTALLLRVGEHLPRLRELPLIQEAAGAPTWFTHGLTIAVLGLLAALEIAATKNSEAEQALETIDTYLKPAMAVITFLGLLSVTDRAFVQRTLQPAAEAGFGNGLGAVIIGAGAYVLAALRSRLREFLFDADEDDDLAVRGLLNWLEDAWVVAGVLFLLLYPVVMLLLLGIALGLLTLIRRHLERREEAGKPPCVRCGTPVYPCAVACPACRHPQAAPRDVGLFGQARARPAPDLEAHPYRLAEKKRCPVCATRLKGRQPRQTCPACGHELFGAPAFAERYADRVSARLPLVLGVCALLSLVPVLGLIPGVLYYRLTVVAPVRRDQPLGRRFCLKWLIRLLFFVLISLQVIPIAGALVIPVMALISHALFRRAFRSLSAGTEPDPA
jgi:hypothetical protein